jgi:hypothetical protein
MIFSWGKPGIVIRINGYFLTRLMGWYGPKTKLNFCRFLGIEDRENLNLTWHGPGEEIDYGD